MNKQRGFTLIELVLFIVITGILASAILLGFVAALQKFPNVRQNMIALQTAQQCMEWLLGQRQLNGYSTVICPSTTVPSFCTAPSGYSVTTDISCTNISGDNNYKTFTVTVSGLGDATLTSLLGNY